MSDECIFHYPLPITHYPLPITHYALPITHDPVTHDPSRLFLVSLSLMKTTFLDFEQPIAELEAKIDELRYVQDDSALDISEEIARLQKKSQALTKEIYGKLTAWQIAQVADRKR